VIGIRPIDARLIRTTWARATFMMSSICTS